MFEVGVVNSEAVQKAYALSITFLVGQCFNTVVSFVNLGRKRHPRGLELQSTRGITLELQNLKIAPSFLALKGLFY